MCLYFYRTQGALLWVVVPESLMDWRDYCHWRETNPTTPSLLTAITEHDFYEMSERVWTHTLAQIIKVEHFNYTLLINNVYITITGTCAT